MKARIDVREGSYQYILGRSGGETTTIDVSAEERERGTADVDVEDGDTITEIVLSSTSDPDLRPARGVIWPAGA